MTVSRADAPESPAAPRIESLLSSRLFLSPQLVDDRLYFISNLSGAFSLYAMDTGGSVPEPLLPPNIALQNPDLVDGYPFYVFPSLNTILVLIDQNGDENYQPMRIPLDGGIPVPAFSDQLAHYRVHLNYCEPGSTVVYLEAESREVASIETLRGDLATGKLEKFAESQWGYSVAGVNDSGTRVALLEGYTFGDTVLSLWDWTTGERRLLFGTPLSERVPEEKVQPSGIGSCHFTPNDRGLLLTTALFEDTYGLGYLDLTNPGTITPVSVQGTVHQGVGELAGLDHVTGNRYRVDYNIDGVSWIYEGRFNEESLGMRLERVLCGQNDLANGVVEGVQYDPSSDRFAFAFSSAISPTQLYTVQAESSRPVRHTRERILGIRTELLSSGEDASFSSHDGLRISARLYLPSPALGFQGPRPLVYYVHGGPQSQERPNFAWFSMPLIQFLTLNGFAVFVPNVRGSEGYGISYMKRVDHDWGGQDRLDHVHAMGILRNDSRLDTSRTGVMGRSYGGYMTLTLAFRHPELWSAAIDMFGPYNLLTFIDRVPVTWKPYFVTGVGDPETEADFLRERSPSTYIDDLACPLLVIQGRNDPRVIEQESHEVVEHLRARGNNTDYLVFDNEGHDVLKFENRVRCYNTITEFFKQHLRP